jgi:flagellar motility protein MotE (MotC chaperone)
MRFPSPRLLPVTIVAIGALLAVKSVDIVRAAMPAAGAAPASQAPVAGAPASTSPAALPAAPAAGPAPAQAGGQAAGHAVTGAPAAPARSGTAAAENPATPPGNAPVSPAEQALLLDLRQRREALDRREAALNERAAVLAAAEKRLEMRVTELTPLQKQLEQLDGQRRQREEASWAGLVKTYETMPPRDAAAIFNDLDKQVLLNVLDRMKERNAAAILAAMQPERARQVTAELARMREQRNAAPGTAAAQPAVPAAGG